MIDPDHQAEWVFSFDAACYMGLLYEAKWSLRSLAISAIVSMGVHKYLHRRYILTRSPSIIPYFQVTLNVGTYTIQSFSSNGTLIAESLTLSKHPVSLQDATLYSSTIKLASLNNSPLRQCSARLDFWISIC